MSSGDHVPNRLVGFDVTEYLANRVGNKGCPLEDGVQSIMSGDTGQLITLCLRLVSRDADAGAQVDAGV